MVIDIQNSYTVKLSSEFIMRLSLKIPSHLKHFGISVNYTLPKAFSLKNDGQLPVFPLCDNR